MSLVVPAVISNASRPSHPFVVLESSVTQSCLPVLNAILQYDKPKGQTLVFCFLHAPSSLVDPARAKNDQLQFFDKTDSIPGYSDNWINPEQFILDTVKSGMYVNFRINKCV
jgi:elongator complex protein 5